MAKIVVRADAVKVKEEDNRDLKVRARVAVRGKDSHVRKVQENPKAPARAEARDKVRVNPSRRRVQVHYPAQEEIARRAQAIHPAMSSSPFPAACHHHCIVQADADVKKSKLCE